MPPFATAGYEHGTNGASLATTDTGDVTPYDTVAAVNNSLIYDNTKALTVGSIAAKHVRNGTGGANCYWAWTTQFGTQTQFYFRGYFEMDSAAPSNSYIIWGVNGTSTCWRIDISNTTGHVVMRAGSGGTTQLAAGTTVVNTGTKFRIEVFVDHVNNVMTVRLFYGANSEGTTPDETLTSSAAAFPFTSTNGVRVGTGGATTDTSTYWSDGIAVATDTWIGPLGGVTNISKTGGAVAVAIAGATKPTQYQRPNADLAATGWTPTPSSPTTLYDKLNETTPDDTNYISATAT